MPSKTPKPVPLTEDEAATWLTFATITEATGDEGGHLVLTRDDGAVLHVSAKPDATLAYEAEGSTA